MSNPKHEVVTLLARRADAEKALECARAHWDQSNAGLIDLISPYKIGDIAEYAKGGKRRRIRIASIQVTRLMKPDTRPGDVIALADMSLAFRGPAILADGKLGKGDGQFLLTFVYLLSRK